jgi:hypothetical protein
MPAQMSSPLLMSIPYAEHVRGTDKIGIRSAGTRPTLVGNQRKFGLDPAKQTRKRTESPTACSGAIYVQEAPVRASRSPGLRLLPGTGAATARAPGGACSGVPDPLQAYVTLTGGELVDVPAYLETVEALW